MNKVTKLLIIVIISTALAVSPAFAGGTAVVEDDPNAGFLNLPPGNGWANYFAGTCEGKCRLNGTITKSANEALNQVPLPFVRGTYMRITGEGDGGGYQLCIPTAKIKNPQLWVFEGGEWKFISSFVGDNGAICANYAGDGVFGLFGISPNPGQYEECIPRIPNGHYVDINNFSFGYVYNVFFNNFDPCLDLVG